MEDPSINSKQIKKRYYFGVPKEVYDRITLVQKNASDDFRRYNPKFKGFTYPEVLRALANPKVGQSYTEIDTKTLAEIFNNRQKKRGIYGR